MLINMGYTVTYLLSFLSILASYQSVIWVAQHLPHNAPFQVLYKFTYIDC